MATQRISERVAVVIRSLLVEKGRGQEWLAAESGIPMRTLARRLHRHNPAAMSLDELSAIAAALETDLISVLSAARGLGESLEAAA